MPRIDGPNAVAACGTLIPQTIGRVKSIAKRVTPEGEPWPEEIRTFLRYLRDLEDQIDQNFPANIK